MRKLRTVDFVVVDGMRSKGARQGSQCRHAQRRNEVEKQRDGKPGEEEMRRYLLHVKTTDGLEGPLEITFISAHEAEGQRFKREWDRKRVQRISRRIRADMRIALPLDVCDQMHDIPSNVMMASLNIYWWCAQLTEALLPQEVIAKLFPERGTVSLVVAASKGLQFIPWECLSDRYEFLYEVKRSDLAVV